MYNKFVLVFYFRWVKYDENNNVIYTLIVRNSLNYTFIKRDHY